METIINKIIENKMRTLLEIINKNYPIKFQKENIDKELEYIIKHINIIVKNTDIDIDIDIDTDTNTTLKLEPIHKQHINTNTTNTTITKVKTKTQPLTIAQENRCSARCWNDTIFDRETMLKIKEIDAIFKVNDFKDINIKKFNKKYILGIQCKKSKVTSITNITNITNITSITNSESSKNNKYCKLHDSHLIHGDYNDIPSKEICYHFMKDGKYL